jgi:butyryl-CoA dehydrogenase
MADTSAPESVYGAPTDPEIRREIIENVRKWVAKEVIPYAAEFEREDEFPAQMVEQMKQMGLFGVTVPETYGGLGLDLITYVGIIEELAYGYMSLSGVINTHTMCATLLMYFGTEEQKQKWLPQMVTGEKRGCWSISEPDAGTDTRNMATKAVKDGDEYVLNGTKAWVTNGERAALVGICTRDESGGYNAFIIEKEPGTQFEGITVAKHEHKLGYKGVETVQMSYDDHRVPAFNLVGTPGKGLSHFLSVLELGRINVASRAVGVARAAFDAALSYAQVRETMGKPIAEHQAIQMKLADMATKLEASRLLVKNAAERKASGQRADVEAGMAKLFASETALELSMESMRIHGGVGYTVDFPVERYYRDAPLMAIGEGTNEIQRMVIARGLVARAQGK